MRAALSNIALALFLLQATSTSADPCSLADGSIITRTDVCDRADIAKDLSDIWYELDADEPDYDRAREIYQDGKNSYKKDSNGDVTSTKRTLKGFSISAPDVMREEPTYNLMRLGMANLNTQRLDDFEVFGDDMVMQSFQDQDGDLPYYTIIVANVFPYIVHKLWDAVDDCAKAPDSVTDNIGLGVRALDEAMAFYVGADQESGGDEGDSFYMLAQYGGEVFQTNDPLAKVNLKMDELYEDASGYLSFNDACTEGSSTVEHLHGVVNRMIGQMNVVLMQLLIHYMVESSYEDDTKNWVKLFASMIVPQASKCRKSTYQFLYDNLIANDFDSEKNLSEVLGALQSIYGCLGFTCEDVGALHDAVLDEDGGVAQVNGVTIGTCADVPDQFPIAGYSPNSNVHQHSLIDLDILEIKQLSSIGLFAAARRIYAFGKHSIKESEKSPPPPRTLKGMATSENRDKIGAFYEIVRDYWGATAYADEFVEEAFEADGRLEDVSDAQRKEIITKTLQYQTVYMYALYKAHDAVQDCDKNDQLNNIVAVNAWDEAVAFFVGSLEGPRWPGADPDDGMLLFNLGTKRAANFGTTAESGTGKFNVDLMEFFDAGKGALERNDCKEVLNIVHKIERITLIPLMQGVLRYASKNEAIASFDMVDKGLAEGEAFAKAILPMVNFYEPDAALVIDENMIMRDDNKPVKDGPQDVADALASVLDDYDIPCNAIGRDGGSADICKNYRGSFYNPRSGAGKSSMVFGFTVAFFAALASVFTF
mmetsp:Transcript_22439/g.32796  ORF Transcript_22439/g.32796 Transcript_22439/m.32796 type:complete len:763 (-) Transcript_22439:139-2427(-)|eukprot:CAMPEP_0195517254 /NCGR_PEP_ID=MMETSP0794_2-20130614/10262_1 /TAXON_ID=515487 /ORGANISM="Stephanopyxis turris, Strain CCMP 815" /LENGTH=762 /DNA_ID=CAMNT_0040646029 /DNA_START=68 /DNA_END=2356 /DNA_ORIENTATION=-